MGSHFHQYLAGARLRSVDLNELGRQLARLVVDNALVLTWNRIGVHDFNCRIPVNGMLEISSQVWSGEYGPRYSCREASTWGLTQPSYFGAILHLPPSTPCLITCFRGLWPIRPAKFPKGIKVPGGVYKYEADIWSSQREGKIEIRGHPAFCTSTCSSLTSLSVSNARPRLRGLQEANVQPKCHLKMQCLPL